jgi:hypothetical protein
MQKYKVAHGLDKLSSSKEDFNEISVVSHAVRPYDQSDALTFKILQAEAKLVRLVLESHGF